VRSDWWLFVGVSSQSIIICTVNMLLVNEKLFFKSQKDIKLIHLWALEALQVWLDIYINQPKINVWSDWWCFLHVSSQTLLLVWYWWMENYFFRSQKDLKLIYLWNLTALELWLVNFLTTKNKYVECLVMVAWSF